MTDHYAHSIHGSRLLANGLACISESLAKAKRCQSKSYTLFPRDGGGATAWSRGGVGSDVTPPNDTSLDSY